MTRVNTIAPPELLDKPLGAEYMEIMDVVSYVEKHGVAKDIPEQYKLNKGHVKFFTNKLLWLRNRQFQIYLERKNRGQNVSLTVYSEFQSRFERVIEKTFDQQIEWKPTPRDHYLCMQRLIEKNYGGILKENSTTEH